jgi:hypothetical protein
MIYFLQPNHPTVVIRDGHDSIDLNKMFSEEVRSRSNVRILQLKDQSFAVSDFSIYSGGDHLIHLCADNREISHVKLSEVLPELTTGRLRDNEGRAFHIAAYVTGSYLDENVSKDRTDFGFEEDTSLWGGLKKDELAGAVGDIVRSDFATEIDHVASENLAGLKEFIENTVTLSSAS